MDAHINGCLPTSIASSWLYTIIEDKELVCSDLIRT